VPETYLIIGAGPGIGLVTARRFADAGYRIVLASRNGEKLERLAAPLRAGGADVALELVDTSDARQVDALVQRRGGEADVLHYNAGALHYDAAGALVFKMLEDTDVATIVFDIGTNITGALVAIRSVVPFMAARKSGTILLTGGGPALKPYPETMTLNVGKAGLRMAAQALFEPLRAKGVHVATVTVFGGIGLDSTETRDIAEAFWQLHTQPPESWTWEIKYRE
jgi:NADP-dependent 3-hydroxy acid dehydrogenase YdfG